MVKYDVYIHSSSEMSSLRFNCWRPDFETGNEANLTLREQPYDPQSRHFSL